MPTEASKNKLNSIFKSMNLKAEFSTNLPVCEMKLYRKVTVDLQMPNFANFVFFAPDIAKTST